MPNAMLEDRHAGLSASIAESGYIGWVVYVDGSPIFQAVPVNVALKQLHADAYYPERRPADRNTVDWKDLPHARIDRLELYGFHDDYTDQPLFRMDREPGADVRYCCMAMAGIAVGTDPYLLEGQVRTGIAGWKLGWFNVARLEYDLWEVTRQGRNRLSPAGGYLPHEGPPLAGHPCWQRPYGFGLAPFVFGLSGDFHLPGD